MSIVTLKNKSKILNTPISQNSYSKIRIKTASSYMNLITNYNQTVKNFPYTNSKYNIPSQSNNIDKVVKENLCNTIITDAGYKTNCRNCNYFKTIKPLSQSEYIKNKTSCNKNN